METDKAISSAGIFVATDRIWSQRFFYQLLGGRIDQRGNRDGIWTGDCLTFYPVLTLRSLPVLFTTEASKRRAGPHVPSPRPYSYVGRFARASLTPDTVSKSLPTWMTKAGIEVADVDQMEDQATPTAGLGAVVYRDELGSYSCLLPGLVSSVHSTLLVH